MESFLFPKSTLSTDDSTDNVLAVFNKTPKKRTTIEQGMTNKEIADIVSDRLLGIILEQFEVTKQNYLAEKAKNKL